MKRFSTLLGLAFGLALWMGAASEAQAASGFHVSLSFHSPRPAVQRVWVPATYEMRTQQVLVQQAHYVKRWVPPVYETRYCGFRRPHTVCVRPGHYERVLIPARYEMRTVRHEVPGYWREAPCHRPAFSFNTWKNSKHDSKHPHGGPVGLARGHNKHVRF